MATGNWDEIRTAYHVARAGTVSGAAEALGVHHATVIRHIDALEGAIGVKLFQRHARGYTPTEAGQELLQVAQATDAQFAQLFGRLRGQGEEVAGELVVTSLATLAPILVPVLVAFQHAHPALTLRFLTDERLFRMEYGEAHVAVRAGPAPQDPDNVVQPFVRERFALYASRDYVARRGRPGGAGDLGGHVFVTGDSMDSRAPFSRWLADHVPQTAMVFRASEAVGIREAICAGAGIGFLPIFAGRHDARLVEVMAPREEWSAQTWLVTHVDLHRSRKVQTLLEALKEQVRDDG